MIKILESDKVTESFNTNEFMKGIYVDINKLISYLKDNGYKFIAGTSKDANHNRQGYQYVFYNGEDYIEFRRSGGTPDSKEIIRRTKTMPKQPSYRFPSYDCVHDLTKEPDRGDKELCSLGKLDPKKIRINEGD